MAGQMPLDVLPARKIIVQPADSAGQGIGSSGHQDMVGMIRHERIACALDMPKKEVLALQSEIEISLRISKKDIAAMVAPLSNVVRATRNHESSKTRHHP